MKSLPGSVRCISIVGVVGVPGRYGGFETLADNLVKYWSGAKLAPSLTVYCSAIDMPSRGSRYMGASLRYLPFRANGLQSVIYDLSALFHSVLMRSDSILILGVSGAVFIPVVRFFSHARIITNIDGIEWRRNKWGVAARFFLRFSEWVAVRFSHVVVADNQAISEYVQAAYGVSSVMIPYGGDHALAPRAGESSASRCGGDYALALCRIEPENNVDLILAAFDRADRQLVFVGNWDNSDYGRALRVKYRLHPRIRLHDPIYDPARLLAVREGASFYVHGHSAGGTNPALVEMMHFGVPIIAYDCVFNRMTTEDKAAYFSDVNSLVDIISQADVLDGKVMGEAMKEIARRRYTWDVVGKKYFEMLGAA